MPYAVIEVRKRGSKEHGPYVTRSRAEDKKIQLMEKNQDNDREFYVIKK